MSAKNLNCSGALLVYSKKAVLKTFCNILVWPGNGWILVPPMRQATCYNAHHYFEVL